MTSVNYPVPSHYLEQCWIIVIVPLGKIISEIFNRISIIFIQEIAFENIVYEVPAIRRQISCIK